MTWGGVAGTSPTSTSWAAVATAAACDASGGAWMWRRYGSWVPSIALTAS